LEAAGLENIKVVMCDTNQEELNGYAKLCRAVCEKSGLRMALSAFSSSQALLFEMSDRTFSASVGIVIVDPANGFEQASASLRRLGYDGIILYLSRGADIKYIYQAFDARAYSFIKKGDLERFYIILGGAVETARQADNRYIALSCAGEYRQIDINEIYYFETAMDHMACVWYAGGKFVFPCSLSSLDERLRDCGFLRIHRSYIISLNAVHRISYDEVVLNNGKAIPVGRGNYSMLKEAMANKAGT